MENRNVKKITTFKCKKCNESNMSLNKVSENGESYIKGYKCNMCGKVNYPIKDRQCQVQVKVMIGEIA